MNPDGISYLKLVRAYGVQASGFLRFRETSTVAQRSWVKMSDSSGAQKSLKAGLLMEDMMTLVAVIPGILGTLAGAKFAHRH